MKLNMAENERQKKIQDQIQADIKKSNAAYKKASPAQRRVMIAKDVIKRIEMEQFIVRRGAFTIITDEVARLNLDTRPSLQLLLHNPDYQDGICKVCAVGGLFCSAVSFRNECNLAADGKIDDDVTPLRQLKEFSEEQKQLIELAFEHGSGYYKINSTYPGRRVNNTKQTRAARDWRFNHFDLDTESYTVLIAIMKNIIKHNGRFNPLVK